MKLVYSLLNTLLLMSFLSCTILTATAQIITQPLAPSYELVSSGKSLISSQNKIAEIKLVNIDQFDSFVFHGNNNINLRYRLLKPMTVKPGQQYPLVIIFHGSGATGIDNRLQVGILAKCWAMNDVRLKYPAYVLVPQFPDRSSDYTMDADLHVLTSKAQSCILTALQLIDSIKNTLPVDRHSIYLEGFSMGGSTVLNAMAMRPDLFAAGVSFSGIPDLYAEEKLLNSNLWLIHGNADTENPFASDSIFYKQMIHKGAKNLRLTVIDQLKHELPVDIYTTDLVPRWLFSKKKK